MYYINYTGTCQAFSFMFTMEFPSFPVAEIGLHFTIVIAHFTRDSAASAHGVRVEVDLLVYPVEKRVVT